MPKCSEITLDNHQWSVLLYGPPGAGKTHIAGTFPKPIFIIDWDGGAVTLRNHPDADKIHYIVPPHNDWGKQEKFWVSFSQGKDTEWVDPQTGEVETYNINDYKTLVIDSVTSLIEVMMPEIAKHVHMKDRLVVNGKRQPHRADYNVAADSLSSYYREAKTTGKHVVMTAHERIEKDDRSNTIVRIGPAMSPAMYTTLSKIPDEIWRLDTRQGAGGRIDRILYTGPEGYFVGKDRLIGAHKIKLEDPEYNCFEKVQRLVQKEKK